MSKRILFYFISFYFLPKRLKRLKTKNNFISKLNYSLTSFQNSSFNSIQIEFIFKQTKHQFIKFNEN